MNPAVLLLSSLYDFATDELAIRLAAADVPYLRLNREQLTEHRLSLDPIAPCLRVTGPTGTHEVGPGLRSVWFRQPVFLRNPSPSPLPPKEQLQRSHWQAFIHALTVFADASWMNHPAATYQAESKTFQLAEATRAGFCVPRSIVGNDAWAIRQSFPGRVAVKSVDTALFRESDEDLFAYTWLGDSVEIDDGNVADAPVVAQQAFDEKVDWRVTVVGTSVVPVKILADGAGASGDWRKTPKEALTYPDAPLPTEVAESCLLLTKSLGLAFGAIDLIQNESSYYFVEINPTGEWGWLSTPERPIGAKIAEWLAEPTESIVT